MVTDLFIPLVVPASKAVGKNVPPSERFLAYRPFYSHSCSMAPGPTVWSAYAVMLPPVSCVLCPVSCGDVSYLLHAGHSVGAAVVAFASQPVLLAYGARSPGHG